MSKYALAVVGATGAVGEEMRRVLEERAFPIKDIRFFASSRSVGRRLPFLGEEVPVEPLEERRISGIDFALFSAGAAVSREWAPVFARAGAVVVDNSSAFRMDPEVPLVVPEVNPDAAFAHRGIVANPNCTTITMLVPLKPLHDLFGLEEVVVASYQSASGQGQKGIRELLAQTRELALEEEVLRRGPQGRPLPEPRIFPRTLAFNVVPQCDLFAEAGYTKEEWKMVRESRKIMGLPELKVSPTCVRVPVAVGHSLAVRARFAQEVDLDRALRALASAPGVALADPHDPTAYTTALETAGTDPVYVGRLRGDLFDPRSLSFWAVGDNLRKGAALNAVQIAELLAAG